MAAEHADRHPPKPRLTLRVGVTGKRVIPEAEVPRIRESLSAVFEALAALLATCRAEHQDVLSDEPAILRITSGMAEGADQLAGEVVIEHFGREAVQASPAVRTRLAAILPFARAEYEKDFALDPSRPKDSRKRTPEELARFVARFEKMLDDPATEAVLEIDDEAILNTGNPADRNLAYANLRDVLLEHCDVLVAVSDDIDGGEGGTVDVIRAAAREGVPIIKISTGRPEVFMMRPARLDHADRTPGEGKQIVAGAPLPAEFEQAIRLMINPPGMAHHAHGDHAEHSSHEEARPARARLDVYLRETFAPHYFDRVFKSFRDGISARPGKDEPLYRKYWPVLKYWKALTTFRATWSSYRAKLSTPEQKAAEMWPDRYNAFADDGGEHVRGVLARRIGWADAMAVRYADATRSAHIAIATLGALAVLIAVTTLVLPQEPEHRAISIKIWALLLEVIVLLLAGKFFFQPAHAQRWHERMVEYRAVAELLRHERFVYALGAADRPGKNADRTWSEPDAWVGWYVRATLRELGFPGKVLSASARRAVIEAFARDELEGDYGQIAYNKGLADRFHTIDHRLEKIVRRTFWFTVYLGIFGVIFLAGFGSIVMYFHDHGGELAHHIIHLFKPWFTPIAAFIPAMIAAIHGIRFQIEFRSTALRAEATMRELAEIDEKVSAALKAPAPSPGRRQSVALVRAGNEAMSSDLAGWSSVYRGKGPELG